MGAEANDLWGPIALALFFAIVCLSLLWTTRKGRRLLARSIGRNLARGEETSIGAWLRASSFQLQAATHELEQNPFERVLRLIRDVESFDQVALSHFFRGRPRLLARLLIAIWFLQAGMLTVVLSGSIDHGAVDALAVFSVLLSIAGGYLIASDARNRGMRAAWWLAAVSLFVVTLPVYLAVRKPFTRDDERGSSDTT
jgi:4-amino-4-deoxy-L-arabinose transferase-like glycosyltransferase